MNRHGWPLVAWLAGACVACGARESLRVDGVALGGSTSDAGSGAGSSGGGGTGAGGSGGTPSCERWVVTASEPEALTNPSGDSMLTAVAVEGRTVLVSSTNNNDPSPDPTWRVRAVRDDLSYVGPSQVALTRSGQISYGGLSVASGSGHRGAVAWDEAQGCRFVALDEEGSAVSSPMVVWDSWCFWLRATSSGFTAFGTASWGVDGLTLLTLSATGELLASKPDLVPDAPPAAYPLWRASLSDGSQLLSWREQDGSAMLERFSAQGDALVPQTELAVIGPTGRLALGALGTKVLAAWSTDDGGPGEIQTQLLDGNGQPLGEVWQLASTPNVEIGSMDVAHAGSGALVAWSDGPVGAYDRLQVQQMSLDGFPEGSAFTVPTPPFVTGVRLAITDGEHGLLLFQAIEPGALTQVFALPLGCAD